MSKASLDYYKSLKNHWVSIALVWSVTIVGILESFSDKTFKFRDSYGNTLELFTQYVKAIEEIPDPVTPSSFFPNLT